MSSKYLFQKLKGIFVNADKNARGILLSVDTSVQEGVNYNL
jgi:hypothetical protein